MVNFRKDIFLSALIIVIAIFLFGLFLGYKFDTLRIDDASRLVRASELDINSFIVEDKFLETFEVSSCEVLEQRISNLGSRLYDIGNTLVAYDRKKLFDRQSYSDLKQQYFSLGIKSYLLRYEMKQKCGPPGHVILYFYDVKDNEESLRQGYVLDNLVSRFDDLTIISIDRQFDDPLLETVKQYYNITRGPSMVIDFELRREGFVSVPEMIAILEK